MTMAAQAVFQLYANLLTEEAHQPWDIIVKEQTESSHTPTSVDLSAGSIQAKRPHYFACASFPTCSHVSHMMWEKI